MKNIILVASIFLIFVSLYNLTRYFSDYNLLSEYGKGYVWGNIFLIATGLILFIFYLRKKKSG